MTTSVAKLEAEKQSELDRLFTDWRMHFAANCSRFTKHNADDFVTDGFFPNYFGQRVAILFVGRESRNINGHSYIDVMLNAYRNTKLVGTQALNSNLVHKRMLYLTFGILNGFPEWPSIPWASEIGDMFGTNKGISFSFLNLSKLSNDGKDYSTDVPVLNAAIEVSTKPRNFIAEEVSILAPEIVITMNLRERLSALGEITPKVDVGGAARTFQLSSGGHVSFLIDMPKHFSAPGNDIRDYYQPICAALEGFQVAQSL